MAKLTPVIRFARYRVMRTMMGTIGVPSFPQVNCLITTSYITTGTIARKIRICCSVCLSKAPLFTTERKKSLVYNCFLFVFVWQIQSLMMWAPSLCEKTLNVFISICFCDVMFGYYHFRILFLSFHKVEQLWFPPIAYVRLCVKNASVGLSFLVLNKRFISSNDKSFVFLLLFFRSQI